MDSGRIEPICLKGMDAVNFIRTLYFPSEKERFEYEKRREDLNNSISIRYYENGFEAEVKDLDLSFLQEIKASSDEFDCC